MANTAVKSYAGGRESAKATRAKSDYSIRKRRTVLWLFIEDYEYLSTVAETDRETKNQSMHRLVKALRGAGVKTFSDLPRRIVRT